MRTSTDPSKPPGAGDALKAATRISLGGISGPGRRLPRPHGRGREKGPSQRHLKRIGEAKKGAEDGETAAIMEEMRLLGTRSPPWTRTSPS